MFKKKFEWEAKKAVGLEDMVLVAKITDDAIVDNIKKRYNEDLIYTYIGPILIALNPYKNLPYYTQADVETYNGCIPHEVPPHIYALTDKMYRDMVSENENQCVIISGESGAGKTVSAKYIMNYIAAVAPKAPDLELVKHIILESNPLLEAFGNAKTLRNNNSSRFGKYFQIEFSLGGIPDGGKISNFLLEKSRVCYQQPGERNFHIFYQLTKGGSREELEMLGLAGPENFFFTNQGRTYDAEGQNDPKDYQEVRGAMSVCQISDEQQASLLQIVAGILHMGNVTFAEDAQNFAIVKNPNALEYPAYLLGVDADWLNQKLTSREISTGAGAGRTSVYDVRLNLDQAAYARNALVKALYSRMFDWIVEAVNVQLAKETTSTCLGVLDIYGFEIFEKNGFEQFCINYVNEKLQQIFIELTLRAEQAEYESEGIQWTPIDFFNNKVVCELIENKSRPPGIMAVLDDVCATMHGQSEGADSKFVQKSEASIGSHPHFTPMSSAFMIKHYAGSVTYDIDGFCEANRDTLYKDLIVLMQSTSSDFIRNLFPEDTTVDERKRPTTASFKIRNQANLLVETLMKCTPHYIRCIKPNDTKKARDWDNQRVTHQVRYLNLKENVRIRRAGFAYRQFFDKFLHRFAILTPETFPKWRGTTQQGIAHIMKKMEVDQKEWQLGRTKLFIKSPETLFMMEEQRQRKYHTYAVRIQRAYRLWKSRKYFIDLRAMSQDVMFGKKERKRISLRRDYIGDYIGYLDNAALRTLMGKQTQVIYADNITKYDRRYKPQSRTLLVTPKDVNIIAYEKLTEGPNKGKEMHVFKRQINITTIKSISVSTMADDFLVLHVPTDYDSLIESVFKTELVVLLMEKAREFGSSIDLNFSDEITYMIKKGKKAKISFVKDNTVRAPTVKGGVVKVPDGLPKDSRNIGQAHAAASAPSRSKAPAARGSGPATRSGSGAAAATSGSSSRLSVGGNASAAAAPSVPVPKGYTSRGLGQSDEAAMPSVPVPASSRVGVSSGGVAVRSGVSVAAKPGPSSSSSSVSVPAKTSVAVGVASGASSSGAVRIGGGANTLSSSSSSAQAQAGGGGMPRVPVPAGGNQQQAASLASLSSLSTSNKSGGGGGVAVRVGGVGARPSVAVATRQSVEPEAEPPRAAVGGSRIAVGGRKPTGGEAAVPAPSLGASIKLGSNSSSSVGAAKSGSSAALPRPPAQLRSRHDDDDDAGNGGGEDEWDTDDAPQAKPVAAFAAKGKVGGGMPAPAARPGFGRQQPAADDEWDDGEPAAPPAAKAKPAVPAAKPAVPAAKPAVPAAKPAVPAAKPAVPVQKPAAAAAFPAPRQAQPRVDDDAEEDDWDTDDAPAKKPAPPALKPTPPALKPTPPTLKPTPPAAQKGRPAAVAVPANDDEWDEPPVARPVPSPRPAPAAKPPPPAKPKLPQCRAVFRYKATQPDELDLEIGDIVTVTKKDTEDDWWEGTAKGKKGVFPSNYVELI